MEIQDILAFLKQDSADRKAENALMREQFLAEISAMKSAHADWVEGSAAKKLQDWRRKVRQLEETQKWQKLEMLLQKCFQHDDAETSAETAPSGNRSIGVVVTPSLPNPGNDISLILVDEIVPDDIKQKSHQHHDENIYDIDEIFVDKNECFEGNSPGTNVTNTLSNIDRNIKDLPILPSSYTSQNPPQILRREILPIGLKSLEKEEQISIFYNDNTNNTSHSNIYRGGLYILESPVSEMQSSRDSRGNKIAFISIRILQFVSLIKVYDPGKSDYNQRYIHTYFYFLSFV
jgi:hypothetical protein